MARRLCVLGLRNNTMIDFEVFAAVSFALTGALWLTMTITFIRWFIGFITGGGRPL